MLKKVLAVVVLAVFILGIVKVQALTLYEGNAVECQKLEELIVIKESGSLLNIQKYSADGMLIYKLGNSVNEHSQVTARSTIYDIETRRIINNGYGKKALENFNVNSEDDLYMATKIALDCISNGYETAEEIDAVYGIKEGLNSEQITRAENIIKDVKDLVDIAYNSKEYYPSSLTILKEGYYAQDVIDSEYTSQAFRIYAEYEEILEYEVKTETESQINYFIANADTGIAQEKFGPDETGFKIMIPNDEKEESFIINVEIEVKGLVDGVYRGDDQGEEFVIYTLKENICTLESVVDNRISQVAINFEDKETLESIYGVVVKINGTTYTIDEDNKILLKKLGKGVLNIEIVSVPDDYVKPEEEYEVVIGYNETHIEMIDLMHKKGSLSINTNAENAVYKIYNLNSEEVGEYTSENGIVYIEQINTGDYIIKQISVSDGYKLAEDIEVTIEYGKELQINIINEETETDTDTDEDENTEIDTDTDTDEDEKTETDTDTDTDEDENTETEKDTEIDTDEDENTEIETDTDTDEDENTETETDTDTDEDENTEIDTDQKENTNLDENNAHVSSSNNDVQDEIDESTNEQEENTDNQDEEEQEEIQENSKELEDTHKEKEEMTFLPRTGKDYFIYKLVLADLILFMIFTKIAKNVLTNQKETDR